MILVDPLVSWFSKARDLLGDLLPYIYMGDKDKVYNFNTRERFTPFVKFYNYGVHELIKQHKFFPYHDISTIKNNSKNYLQVTNYVDTKIYPKHSQHLSKTDQGQGQCQARAGPSQVHVDDQVQVAFLPYNNWNVIIQAEPQPVPGLGLAGAGPGQAG